MNKNGAQGQQHMKLKKRAEGSDKEKWQCNTKNKPNVEGSNKCNWQCNEFKQVVQNTMGSNQLKLAVQILGASITETGSKKTWASTHEMNFEQIKMAVQILRQQQIKSCANTASSDE